MMVYLAAAWIVALLTLGAWLAYELRQDKRDAARYEPRDNSSGRLLTIRKQQ